MLSMVQLGFWDEQQRVQTSKCWVCVVGKWVICWVRHWCLCDSVIVLYLVWLHLPQKGEWTSLVSYATRSASGVSIPLPWLHQLNQRENQDLVTCLTKGKNSHLCCAPHYKELEAHTQLPTNQPVPFLFNQQRHHLFGLDLTSYIPSKLFDAKG